MSNESKLSVWCKNRARFIGLISDNSTLSEDFVRVCLTIVLLYRPYMSVLLPKGGTISIWYDCVVADHIHQIGSAYIQNPIVLLSCQQIHVGDGFARSIHQFPNTAQLSISHSDIERIWIANPFSFTSSDRVSVRTRPVGIPSALIASINALISRSRVVG